MSKILPFNKSFRVLNSSRLHHLSTSCGTSNSPSKFMLYSYSNIKNLQSNFANNIKSKRERDSNLFVVYF